MSLPLIYHEDYSPHFPADHRFPMDKFRLLRDHLIDSGLTTDAQLLRPDVYSSPGPRSFLCTALYGR